jgi:putative solute:sodium symporter small subunit
VIHRTTRERRAAVSEIAQDTDPGDGEPRQEDNGWRREYWRRNLRLMVILLVIWFAVSFGAGILFVEQLNEIEINNFPLGFWFAQQGSIYTFVILILVYAVLMDRLDKQFGVDEREEEGGRP